MSDDASQDEGTPLRRIRAERGWTQQQLADLLERSRTQVSAWEYGRGMTEKSRAYVASKLGVAPECLGPVYDPETPRPHQYSRGKRRTRGPLRNEQALVNPRKRRDADTLMDRSDTPNGFRDDDLVKSSSPTDAVGGAALMKQHQDSELLAALIAFWDDMSPEARLELVGHGHRLRKASAAPTAGFKVG